MLLKIYSSKICYWRTLSRCSCWCKDCYNTKSCRRTQIMTASPRTSWSLKLVTKFRMWTTRESGYLSQKVRMKQSLLLRKLVDTSLKVLDWVQHPGWCLRLATAMTWLGDHRGQQQWHDWGITARLWDQTLVNSLLKQTPLNVITFVLFTFIHIIFHVLDVRRPCFDFIVSLTLRKRSYRCQDCSGSRISVRAFSDKGQI